MPALFSVKNKKEDTLVPPFQSRVNQGMKLIDPRLIRNIGSYEAMQT